MEELKPCPFCGCNSIDKHGWYDGQGNIGPECDNCGATARSMHKWNTRHIPEGYALVPVEPTDGMTFIGQSMRYESLNSIGAIYKAMIAAAQEQK
jgi:hypothetical protein